PGDSARDPGVLVVDHGLDDLAAPDAALGRREDARRARRRDVDVEEIAELERPRHLAREERVQAGAADALERGAEEEEAEIAVEAARPRRRLERRFRRRAQQRRARLFEATLPREREERLEEPLPGGEPGGVGEEVAHGDRALLLGDDVRE